MTSANLTKHGSRFRRLFRWLNHQPEVILHIGQHKTASSTIQNSLQGAERARLLSGVRYCEFSRPNHSFLVASAFADPACVPYHKSLKFGSGIPYRFMKAQSAKEHIKNELNTAREQKVPLILSAEDFCALSYEELAAAKLFFSELGVKRVRVIGYARSVESWANSFSQQIIKQGVQTIDEVSEIEIYPKYRENFEKFVDLFGEENVYISAFDKSALKSGCIVADFLSKCDIIGAEIPVINRNTSINLFEAKVASRVIPLCRQRAGRNYSKYRPLVQSYCSEFGGRKFSLQRKTLDRCREAASDDIEWARDTLKIDEDFLLSKAAETPREEYCAPVQDWELMQFYRHCRNMMRAG